MNLFSLGYDILSNTIPCIAFSADNLENSEYETSISTCVPVVCFMNPT